MVRVVATDMPLRKAKVPAVVVREPRTWLKYLRVFPPEEQVPLRPVLEWLDKSREWLWVLCRHCGQRFTVREGDTTYCYPCRRRLPAWTRSRARKEQPSRGHVPPGRRTAPDPGSWVSL
jgi:hypothetical protein